jgi:hypothetical protein
MKRVPVHPHQSTDVVGDRYRRCPDPREKTRWQLVWLLLQDPTLTCERAGPLVGLSDTHARTVLKRWNADGADGLTDGRTGNRSAGKVTPTQQAEAFDAWKGEPPDGGLWSGPKLARHARDRWGGTRLLIQALPHSWWRSSPSGRHPFFRLAGVITPCVALVPEATSSRPGWTSTA